MKKIIGILSVFLGIGIIVCFVLGFITKINFEVSSASVFIYRLCTSIEYFINYLPAIIMTGYVVSLSVYFGRNAEGSTSRFSKAMLERFKLVIISGIICTAFMTFNNDVFYLMTQSKKKSIVNRPKIVNEYVKTGSNLFERGEYERAMVYANAALKLNPNEKRAQILKDNADVEINRLNTSNLRFKLYQAAKETVENVDRVKINAKEIADVYQCYDAAVKSFELKEWFNAHYYAELGINLATPKDPNLEALKKLSTEAWNNITLEHNLDKSPDQKDFDKKYEGYLALVEKDDLKAYYIFRDLFQTSRTLQNDPDVLFYLEIAENRVCERSFFIDETFELESFESANDIYFAYEYKDGSKDIIYFKGVTTVKETGNSVQYLRNLTIKSVTGTGELFRTMTVPYAKVLPVSVKNMNSISKNIMGIDDSISFVPYIMLNSVSKNEPKTEIKPVYTFETGEISNTPEYLILPISFDDLCMLENVNEDLDTVSIQTLFKLVFNAKKYGYSEEVYGSVLLARLFYPLWIFILFILLAAFAWNNRIDSRDYFKFSWSFSFPAFLIAGSMFYKLSIQLFKIINHTLTINGGIMQAIMLASVIYICLFILISLYFLSRSTK